MQLALIDHNSHLSRKERTSSVNNETQYRRVFRKTSKKWDAVPVMEKKNYVYLVPMCQSILQRYLEFDGCLVEKVSKRDSHPELIASNIASVEPPSTSSIVKRKCTRFQ